MVSLWFALALSAQDGGCGYVSVAAKPPQSESLYPADIRRIDGVEQKLRDGQRIALPVGRHKIALQEQVASTPRGYTLLRKLGNQETNVVLKIIEIDVAADRHYVLAAKVDPDKIDRARPNDFWQPVVFRESEASCR